MMLLLVAVTTTGFVACEEELGPSIFDTKEYPLDRTTYTFPLDTFVKVNFLEPYNLRFIYRMEDVGSDKDKNLVPARYEQSVKLAVLSKYLWYDIYDKYAGDLFLKENSPRIIHVIGSKSYNPSQGTETLGVAEGGIKITLYGANQLDERDIDYMNKYFFHTMHHEFGHILDQTKLHPTAFNTISTGQYDAMGWSDTPDSVSCGRGFVTSYGSSNVSEDLVEISSTYITADTLQWIDLLNSASYEWEFIDTDYSSEAELLKAKFGSATYRPTPAERDTVGYFHRSENGDNKIYRKACRRDADDRVLFDESVKKYNALRDTVTNSTIKISLEEHKCDYENCPHSTLSDADVQKTLRDRAQQKLAALDAIKVIIDNINWNADKKAALSAKLEDLIVTATLDNYAKVYKQIATLCSDALAESQPEINAYVNSHIDWVHDLGQTGRDIILTKLDLVRTWFNESFGFSIDNIRREVQQRQYVTDSEGNFVTTTDFTGKKKLVNRLTSTQEDGRSLMEHLLDEVEQYKSLQK